MEIKGAAVKTIPQYIKERYPDYYDRWMLSLPKSSLEIMAKPIMVTGWYPVKDAMVVPTEELGKLLFADDKEAAWKLGRFSSEVLLKGVYKIFIRVSSPLFVLSRVSNVLGSHYRPAQVEIIEKGKQNAKIEFRSFDKESKLALYRIAGWIEKTIETCGFSNIDIEINNTGTDYKPAYTIEISWSN